MGAAGTDKPGLGAREGGKRVEWVRESGMRRRWARVRQIRPGRGRSSSRGAMP